MLLKYILTVVTLATGLTPVLAIDSHGATSLGERRDNEFTCPDCTSFCGEGKDHRECRHCLGCTWPTDPATDDEDYQPDRPNLKPRENCDAACGPHGNTQACAYCRGTLFLTPPVPFARRSVDPASRKDCSQPCGPHGNVMDCAWCRGGVFLPPTVAVETEDVDSEADEDTSISDEPSVTNSLLKRKDCAEYCGVPGKVMDCAWCRSWRHASESENLDAADNSAMDMERDTDSEATTVEKRDAAPDPSLLEERKNCDKWCKTGPHVNTDLCTFCETGLQPWPIGHPPRSVKREVSKNCDKWCKTGPHVNTDLCTFCETGLQPWPVGHPPRAEKSEESIESDDLSFDPMILGCRDCGRKNCHE